MPLPQRALITGGAGFVGSHLAERLVAEGLEVCLLDDLSTGRLANLEGLEGHPGVRFVKGSASEPATLEPLVAVADVVFHLAAPVGVELVLRDTVAAIERGLQSTQTLLRTASAQGTKVLLASTSEVYGKSERLPFREDDDRLLGSTDLRRWSYAALKTVDEHLALAYHQQRGLEVVVFRLFNAIGPRQRGDYGMVVPRLVQQALQGRALTVYGDGRQTRCFLDVLDAVDGIWRLACEPTAVGCVFNLGGTEEISILELAQRISVLVAGAKRDAKGEDGTIESVPYCEAYGEGFEDMRRRRPDLSRIAALTGWLPKRSLDQTLRRIVSACREEAVVAAGAGLRDLGERS